MRVEFSPPDITEEEIQEVAAALRSGWITTGPRTKEFERGIAALCGTQKAVCLGSATACMEMTLRIMGIVIVDGMHLLHASGHVGPKSYRSSWEGPALSFCGAGGAS